MATPAFEDIAETFDFLDDWEDRYRHVIELGRAMPPMDPALQVPATKVEGCASQVWIMPRIEDGRVQMAAHLREECAGEKDQTTDHSPFIEVRLCGYGSRRTSLRSRCH